jgi:hypothetical protein
MLVTNTMIIKAVEDARKAYSGLFSIKFDKLYKIIEEVQKNNDSLDILFLTKEIERIRLVHDRALGRLEGLLAVWGEQ